MSGMSKRMIVLECNYRKLNIIFLHICKQVIQWKIVWENLAATTTPPHRTQPEITKSQWTSMCVVHIQSFYLFFHFSNSHVLFQSFNLYYGAYTSNCDCIFSALFTQCFHSVQLIVAGVVIVFSYLLCITSDGIRY